MVIEGQNLEVVAMEQCSPGLQQFPPICLWWSITFPFVIINMQCVSIYQDKIYDTVVAATDVFTSQGNLDTRIGISFSFSEGANILNLW